MERLVFVYGSLKRGFYNHRILTDGGARYDGPAVTVHPYIMAHGVAYPYVIDPMTLPNTADIRLARGQVTGEVYCVDAETLQDLDRLEGHPDFYERKLVSVAIREEPHSIFVPVYTRVQAWLYFYPGDRNLGSLDDALIGPDAYGNLTWTQADIESDLAQMKG